MPAVNYVLVRRNAHGRAEALSIGRVNHGAPSLNLAEIRQRGAELGADEVHQCTCSPDNAKIGKLVEFDLRTGQVEAELRTFGRQRRQLGDPALNFQLPRFNPCACSAPAPAAEPPRTSSALSRRARAGCRPNTLTIAAALARACPLSSPRAAWLPTSPSSRSNSRSRMPS